MAHVIKTKTGGKFYTITYDPLLAWDSATAFPSGMEIVGIEMAPVAAANAVVVRDGGATGPRIFSHVAEDDFHVGFRSYHRSRDPHAPNPGFRGVLCQPTIAAAEATGAFDITFELA